MNLVAIPLLIYQNLNEQKNLKGRKYFHLHCLFVPEREREKKKENNLNEQSSERN